MVKHSAITFDGLHKAKFDSGTDAAKPAAPEGVGDVYWAYDGNGGAGALYIADATGSAWVNFSGAGAASIDDLSDVTITSPSNRQALIYNGVSTQWENAFLVFSDISDVTLTHAKGKILVSNGTNLVELNVGTDGQVLTANSAAPNGIEWAAASAAGSIDDLSDVDTSTTPPVKGALLAHDGTQWVTNNVGTDGQVLTASAASANGVAWGDVVDDDARKLAIIGW
ncbi:MAG: hypothetical protein D6706_06810 [Chloroflexi bacterium]|nr:MAG: hypothetical protein D6706_06810 [Chloroflexota bacterium]